MKNHLYSFDFFFFIDRSGRAGCSIGKTSNKIFPSNDLFLNSMKKSYFSLNFKAFQFHIFFFFFLFQISDTTTFYFSTVVNPFKILNFARMENFLLYPKQYGYIIFHSDERNFFNAVIPRSRRTKRIVDLQFLSNPLYI